MAHAPTLTRILVATDMSPRSDRAVERAFVLARSHALPVEVLTVLDDAMPADLTSVLHERARNQVERFAKAAAKGAQHTVTASVGDPTEEILTAAKGDPGTLLVMGVHRPRPFLDALRETTMQRIVRRTATPVLLVRDAADHGYDKVIAACDFSPACSAALTLAQALSPNAGLRPIHALHVPYSGMLARQPGVASDLEAAFRHEAQSDDTAWRASGSVPDGLAETEIMTGSPAVILQRLVNTDEADLIAVGAHGRVGAARSILGSLSTDLMRDPPCDILIARP